VEFVVFTEGKQVTRLLASLGIIAGRIATQRHQKLPLSDADVIKMGDRGGVWFTAKGYSVSSPTGELKGQAGRPGSHGG